MSGDSHASRIAEQLAMADDVDEADAYERRAEGTQSSLAGYSPGQTHLDDLDEDDDVLPEDEQGACPHVSTEDLPCFDCFEGDEGR